MTGGGRQTRRRAAREHVAQAEDMSTFEMHDHTSEDWALAVLLTNDAAVAIVLDELREDDFYTDSRRQVFRAAGQLRAEGASIDAATVCAHLPADQREQVSDYVFRLADLAAVGAHAKDYCASVKNFSAKRRGLRAADLMREAVLACNGDMSALPGLLERIPAEAAAEIRVRTGVADFADRVRTPAEVCAMAGDRPDWVIFGLVARNAITEIIAKMKTGKTDVILAGVNAILTGDDFLGHATQRVEVLYLAEERPPSFADALRRRGMERRSGLHILLRSDTLNMTWPQIVEFVRAYVRANGIGLVVVDTLSDWASLAADEENDSSAALEAIRPLQLLAADNVAVWTGRHSRKGYAGDVADSGRGSGAFTGAVEIVLGLQKMAGSGNKNQRKVVPVGRFNDTPAEPFVIERQGYSYTVIGTPGQVGREGARQALLEGMPGSREGAVSASALFKAASVTSTIGYELLKDLKAKGIVVAEKGAGTSGKAEGFWHPEGEL